MQIWRKILKLKLFEEKLQALKNKQFLDTNRAIYRAYKGKFRMVFINSQWYM